MVSFPTSSVPRKQLSSKSQRKLFQMRLSWMLEALEVCRFSTRGVGETLNFILMSERKLYREPLNLGTTRNALDSRYGAHLAQASITPSFILSDLQLDRFCRRVYVRIVVLVDA